MQIRIRSMHAILAAAALALSPAIAVAQSAAASNDSTMIVKPIGAVSTDPSVFGPAYAGAGAVVPNQVRIVYYRERRGAGGSHLYVDGQFYGSLLPGGYVSFCLKPGDHTFRTGTEQPGFPAKHAPQYRASLAGGKIYFLKVREEGDTPVAGDDSLRGAPISLRRDDAERELLGTRLQVLNVPRTATVVPCELAMTGEDPVAVPTPMPVAKPVAQTPARPRNCPETQRPVLFGFDRADADGILPAGREAMRCFVEQLRAGLGKIAAVVVEGHADLIGPADYNDRLAKERADTVRRQLVEQGLPANLVSVRSRSATQPVFRDCADQAPLSERIACNQPNRRVELLVERREAPADPAAGSR